MKRNLILHYSEIGLKKANKEYFLKKLKKRMKWVLEKEFKETFHVKHILGRFLIPLDDDFDEEKFQKLLSKVFGIKNFKFTFAGSIDIEKLSKQIYENLPDLSEIDNFRVKVKRSQILPYKSTEAEREIGANLLKMGLDKKVKLKDPDLVVDIEFFNNYGFFSYKKYSGPGGLSPNSQGKLVSLMSAGFDSPVASYRMMRRGARVIFIHFHGYPYTDKDEMEQVKELTEILGKYQFDTKLYLLPFGKFQKSIGTNLKIPGKVRTIIYRRMMLRIAEIIAKKEKAKGIVTGECFGQVASQTPDNIYAIHDASTIPLYQPLIGYDKEEIIRLAENIGTADISKLPCKDTCTMFMSRKSELNANPYDMREYEELLSIDEWIEKILSEKEVLYFD